MFMPDYQHTVALVANGSVADSSALALRIREHQSIICVDGGLVFCRKMGITPDMIVGDFDSIPPEILRDYASVPIRSFPTDKDESDLELAIQSIYTPSVEKITVFGATGHRVDHTLANLQVLRRYPCKVYFETDLEIIFAIDGETEIPCVPGQTISFIPMDDQAAGITTTGLKWELNDASFSKYFFSLSNICRTDTVKIAIQTGDLICCMQKKG